MKKFCSHCGAPLNNHFICQRCGMSNETIINNKIIINTVLFIVFLGLCGISYYTTKEIEKKLDADIPNESPTYNTSNVSFRNSKNELLMKGDVLEGAYKVKKNDKDALALKIKDKDLFYAITSNLSQQDDKTLVLWIDYVDEDFNNELYTCGSMESKCLFYAEVTTGFEQDIIIYGDTIENNIDDIIEKINN